jgi:hypothetical protein
MPSPVLRVALTKLLSVDPWGVYGRASISVEPEASPPNSACYSRA